MRDAVYTVLFVLGVTVIFSLISQKQKKSTWEGRLINKKESYDDESGKTTYYLIFQTDTGKKKVNLSSAKAEYDKWHVDDVAIKKSGVYFP
jgi:hypothetical protein